MKKMKAFFPIFIIKDDCTNVNEVEIVRINFKQCYYQRSMIRKYFLKKLYAFCLTSGLHIHSGKIKLVKSYADRLSNAMTLHSTETLTLPTFS